jgi:hypothetical protein
VTTPDIEIGKNIGPNMEMKLCEIKKGHFYVIVMKLSLHLTIRRRSEETTKLLLCKLNKS